MNDKNNDDEIVIDIINRDARKTSGRRTARIDKTKKKKKEKK